MFWKMYTYTDSYMYMCTYSWNTSDLWPYCLQKQCDTFYNNKNEYTSLWEMPCVRVNKDWPFNPLSPHDALMHHFTFLKTDWISFQLICQYMVIFFNFPLTPNHLQPLQVENCGSSSRLVVDEDDSGKFRLESRVVILSWTYYSRFK